ncbi:hypothetical protein D9611_013194 [Ephemerocybe angulata]|uniref:DDE Tnp4 domain-containing protein n=1 Tax=Ephemerocybe angulata TaxID=980116 RepID=A0A8H5BVL0_9AGAR|nr:hypothetical protein D9611_013194 [Tulosesus angulatus]
MPDRRKLIQNLLSRYKKYRKLKYELRLRRKQRQLQYERSKKVTAVSGNPASPSSQATAASSSSSTSSFGDVTLSSGISAGDELDWESTGSSSSESMSDESKSASPAYSAGSFSSFLGASVSDESNRVNSCPTTRGPPTRRIRHQIEELYQHRYWQGKRKNKRRFPSHMTHLLRHRHSEPEIFRQDCRINPHTFDELVSELEEHPVFLNKARNQQMLVEHQVAITLYRFGHFGNAASLNKISRWAGCGKGTVTLVTRRVMTAVLAPEFLHSAIHLPTDEEKVEAKKWVQRHSCKEWSDGWCFVDGTLVPLYKKPKWFGESYYDRKSNYSLSFQIINLPNLQIFDVGYGHTGSTHDSTAWEQTRTFKEHTSILKDNEFIWADSAYPIQTWVVTPYKKPDSEEADNTIYNNHLSHLRIRSEHAIGFLKGRFQSLKGLRVDITSAKTHQFAVYWVLSCIAIHAFAIASEQAHKESPEDNEFIYDGLSDAEDATGGGAVHPLIPQRPVSRHPPPPPSPPPQERRADVLALARARREDLKKSLLNSLNQRAMNRANRNRARYGEYGLDSSSGN